VPRPTSSWVCRAPPAVPAAAFAPPHTQRSHLLKLLDQARQVPRVRRFAPGPERAAPLDRPVRPLPQRPQGRLGHADVSTTLVHTHVLGRGPAGAPSPLDQLAPASPDRARADIRRLLESGTHLLW